MSRRKGSRIRKKNGELIRVLFAGHHSCIRVHKQLKSLKNLGYKVDLLTNSISYGTDAPNNVYFFHNKEQFMNVMKDVGHLYDVVHWHNEPDEQGLWFYESRKENNHNYPIIFDWHDIDSIRLGRPNKNEVKAFRLMDGLVFVSEPCREAAKELYDFKQPSTILWHYCNEGLPEWTPGEEDRKSRTGLVYQGGANPPDHMVPPEQRQVFRYRTMYPFFKESISNGNELTLYIGNPPGYQSHLDIGAKVFPPTIYSKLMNDMVKFKWGWCIFGAKGDPQTEKTQANKFWEYLQCGAVPICCWCKETEKTAKELGVGIVLEHPDELGNIEENFGHLYSDLKDRVDQLYLSKELTMENNIWRIEKLWSEVL